ncbi:MAG: polysaccharide biosynthesis C-terminal domain-containing protein [Bacteroidetes bacterium]|nr:polysaccharide biosynthesis C-terminal domain-containing protein [Bacteroidota bacterium]
MAIPEVNISILQADILNMSFLKKIFSVSIAQVIGNFCTMIAGIILARTLGPTGIGQFETFRSFDVIAVTICCVGLGNSSMYFINNLQTDPREVTSTMFRISLGLSFILVLAMTTCILIFPEYFGKVSKELIAIYLLGSVCSLNTLCFKTVLTARLQSTRLIIIDQLPRISLLLLTSFWLFLKDMNFKDAIIIVTIGNILSLSTLFFFLHDLRPIQKSFNSKLSLSLLKYGIRLSVIDLLFVLTGNVTIILLRNLSGSDFSLVGVYSRAVAISGLVSLVPYTVGPLLYSRFARLTGSDITTKTEFALRSGIAFSGFASLVVYLFRYKIVNLLYGNQFERAAEAIAILAPSLVFFCICMTCTNLLSSQGRANTNIKILASSLLIVFITGYFGIKAFGLKGAALASLFGNMTAAIGSLYWCSRLFGLNIKNSLILKWKDIQSLFVDAKKMVSAQSKLNSIKA